jgi:uncharacterized protein YbdZ (MbtH family)
MRSQAEMWKISSYSIHSINTSYNEVTSTDVKDVIVLHPLNKYFIQWGPHCMKYLLSEWSTMTPFTHFLIVTSMSIDTSYNEVTMGKGMKGVIVLHPLNKYFIQWDHNEKKVWKVSSYFSSYWKNGVRWHLSYLFSLWPHCMKYLLRKWSTMTSFTSLLVTSLYEVVIERMEYDDTFHTSAHSDLIVRSIYWGDGVRWHLQ